MSLIIEKIQSLANLPPLTDKEQFAKTSTWAQALFSIIPERKLQECYLRAVADHESEYAISALNLKTAWKKICSDEKHRREANRLNADRGAFYGHAISCYRCRDTNVEMVYTADGKFKGAKPGCDHRPLDEGEWLWKEEQRLDQVSADLLARQRSGEGRMIDDPNRSNQATGNVIDFEF
jgi:hypothetical protein